MRRVRSFLLLPLLLLSVCALFAQAPAPTLKVKLRAALFDRDLNVKPVPHLVITLRSVDNAQQAPAAVQTSLDGVAEVEVPPGNYQVITAKPVELTGKVFLWDFAVKLSKPDVVELSNDNARVTDVTGGRGVRVDELAEQYRRVKDSVVAVWAEDYRFNGVLMDPSGLVLTTYAGVEGHDWLAVQFDATHKVRAHLLTFNKAKDVAVLRLNLEPIPNPNVAQISADPTGLIEGERVFTIKDSRKEGKMLRTGIVSKATAETITSDVKFEGPGGALFNSTGMVVGFIRVSGDKLALVPIATASDTLAEAKAEVKMTAAPAAHLLPCHPEGDYPADALRAKSIAKWEKDIYYSKLGDFEIELYTPVSQYAAARENYLAESKQREKYVKKGKEPPAITEPDYRYTPALLIEVRPTVKMAFWKSMGDAMLTDGHAPDTYRYKGSFVRMKLWCGKQEVEPIWPRRVPVGGYSFGTYSKAGYANVEGASYKGDYMFPHDAISPECGEVTLEITSAKDEKPLVKVLDPRIVSRLWEDFADYRKPQPATLSAGSQK